MPSTSPRWRSTPTIPDPCGRRNDLVDSSPCQGSNCDLTPDIGISGIYFFLDEGATWIQPTYTGLTAQTGTPHIGPIHTLPNYFENGMSSHGDPALAFGPKPGPNGFSWANGSRLYYANITFPLTGQTPFTGPSAAVVSRTDNVQAAAANDQSAWMDPVVVSRQNTALFSDKEDIWADNAASSAFFGNVYVCNTAFRSISGPPAPIVLSASSDGGSTWRQRQLTSAVSNAQSGGRQGCAVRTDSIGVVYVVWEGTAAGQSVFYLARSFDGGANSRGRSWWPASLMWACSTGCRGGSSSMGLRGRAPTASRACRSPTAPRPARTPPIRWCSPGPTPAPGSITSRRLCRPPPTRA
jgi:hypothetical protein